MSSSYLKKGTTPNHAVITATTLTNVFPEGMDNLSELKCLYLHNNRIENLSVSIDFKIILFNWN